MVGSRCDRRNVMETGIAYQPFRTTGPGIRAFHLFGSGNRNSKLPHPQLLHNPPDPGIENFRHFIIIFPPGQLFTGADIKLDLRLRS